MQDALSSYVPHMLWERVAAAEPLTRPESTSRPAAVLLSDIKGFTSLVKEFVDAGKEGLEELSWSLNSYFSDVADAVYAHGGDVLYIAGDAFLCAWLADQEDADALGDAALRACQAGLAIQAAVHERPCGRGRHFETRIGIGAGELLTAFVGGHGGRWELVASGSAVHDAVAAETAARPGHVLLSGAARSLVTDQVRGTAGDAAGSLELVALESALPARAVPSRADPIDPDRIVPFVPPAVLERGFVPGEQWLAESRTVSVVLADLPQLEDATAESLGRTHKSIRTFQEVVERFEGTVKVDVDSKGILLLAVFGLPPRAHEDDAARAIETGWALREQLAATGVDCSVGVATGRVLCGSFGSDVRREYMVRGDAINLAARLMTTAEDEILCCSDTAAAIEGRANCASRGEVSVKGRAEPVACFEPRRWAQGPTRQVGHADEPVIGRVSEQAQLAALLAGVIEGTSGTILIEGEAGMGKSRLLLAAEAYAEGQKIRVLRGAADAIDNARAYHPWRPLFQALFGIDRRDDAVQARRRVDEVMAQLPEMERLVPLLSEVLPVRIPDTDLTAGMTGDVRAENTRRVLVRLLQQAAESRPTALLMEDAHWFDSSSWGLLLEVVRSVRPLVVLTTTRPGLDPGIGEYGRLLRHRDVTELRLEGLSAAETRTLIEHRLRVDQVPDALAEFVQQRVSGHPFYCEELLAALQESGTIRIDGGRCEVGNLSELDLPSTIEGVILSRIDRLDPGPKLCIKVASVIGAQFRARTVQEMLPKEIDAAQVPDHLEALTEQSLTLRDAAIDEPAYVFKHMLTRDVAYELMPRAVVQPLHASIARWYEDEFAEDLSPHYGVLAHHWDGANVAPKTVDYLELSGQEAVRRGAFTEAVGSLSRAVELEQRGGVDADTHRKAAWSMGLANAHYFLGDLQNGRTQFEDALARSHKRVPTGTWSAVPKALAATLKQAKRCALPPKSNNGDMPEDKPRLDEIVGSYKRLGDIYYLHGRPAPEILYLVMNGLNLGDRAGPSPGFAWLLSGASMMMSFLGLRRWSDHYMRRAIEMAELDPKQVAAGRVWHVLALMFAQRGDWDKAKEANDTAHRLIQERGDFNLEPEAAVVRATIHMCEGDLVSAEPYWQLARKLGERNENPQILCWAVLDQVDTATAQGRIEDAAAFLDEALALPTQKEDGGIEIDRYRAIAVTRLLQGRHEEAVDAADVVLRMITEQQPTGYHWLDFCASAVEVYLDVLASGSDYAKAHASELEKRARSSGKVLMKLSKIFANVRPRAHLLAGLLAQLQGHDAKARRSWQQALSEARALRMPFEEARALVELARNERGPDADRHLDRAIEILDPLGQTVRSAEARALRSEAGGHSSLPTTA